MSNALSTLLKRVAIRVMRNNPTNELMLETADRVVLWTQANYIGDEEVSEIAAAVPQEGQPDPQDEQQPEPAEAAEPEDEEVSEVAETEGDIEQGSDEPGEEDASQGYDFTAMTATEVWRSLSYRPTKDELVQACDWLGIEHGASATNAELTEMLRAAYEAEAAGE